MDEHTLVMCVKAQTGSTQEPERDAAGSVWKTREMQTMGLESMYWAPSTSRTQQGKPLMAASKSKVPSSPGDVGPMGELQPGTIGRGGHQGLGRYQDQSDIQKSPILQPTSV